MDQVVAQQHRERLAAHVLLGRRHGVPEAERVPLADVVDRGDLADLRGRSSARRACPSSPGSTRARRSGRSGPRSLRLPRPVTMRMSVRPARAASSTTSWIDGVSTTGSISFGCAFVAGRNRVPSPAAGMTAFFTFTGGNDTRLGGGRPSAGAPAVRCDACLRERVRILRRAMPTYEYVCRDCGHGFEILQSFKDESLTICPACGGELRKVFAAPAISFKGSGFYATDNRKGSKSSESKHDGAKQESSKSDATSDGSKGEGSKDTESRRRPRRRTAPRRRRPRSERLLEAEGDVVRRRLREDEGDDSAHDDGGDRRLRRLGVLLVPRATRRPSRSTRRTGSRAPRR